MNKYSSGTHLRVTIEGKMQSGVLNFGSGHWLTIGQMDEGSVEVIQPEIVTGQFYLDADGNAWRGMSSGSVVSHTNDGRSVFRGNEIFSLPAGLRAAKLVPVDE